MSEEEALEILEKGTTREKAKEFIKDLEERCQAEGRRPTLTENMALSRASKILSDQSSVPGPGTRSEHATYSQEQIDAMAREASKNIEIDALREEVKFRDEVEEEMAVEATGLRDDAKTMRNLYRKRKSLRPKPKKGTGDFDRRVAKIEEERGKSEEPIEVFYDTKGKTLREKYGRETEDEE